MLSANDQMALVVLEALRGAGIEGVLFAGIDGTEKAIQNVKNGTFAITVLQDAAGEMVGMNLDPSHLFWMGGYLIASVRALEGEIYHVHAKDVRLERGLIEAQGALDLKTIDQFAQRSWNFVALGYGHDALWWKEFLVVLKMSGYDGLISIEQEDLTMPPMAGVEKAISFLRNVLPESER